MADTSDPNSPSGAQDRRPNLVFFVVLLLMLAVLVSLGNWQVRRLHWKQGLIATIEQRIQQAPVELDVVLTSWRDTGDVEYYPLLLSGTFRHDNEQHFLATHKGQSGWYVYTPLEMVDGRMVIVNRGFVPYDLKDASARPWQPVETLEGAAGLARNPLSAKPGWVVPENTPADTTWYWKDFDTMAETMGIDSGNLVPFFVDLAAQDNPETAGPIPGVTRVILPNRHLEYAVTWFGLAAALLGTAGFVVWRGMRRHNSS